MAEAAEKEIETTTLKSYVVSAVYALFGLSGLAGVDYLTHRLPHQPWWLLAVQNAFAIVAGTGFIGILFELGLRRNLVAETVVRLKTLFDEDTQFAHSLSDSARERRVENTLKAHLGAELGQAIFLGLVHRYFVQPTRYRKDARLVVALSACSEVKVNSFLTGQTHLDVSKYCSLVADYSFKVKFPNAGIISVICTFSDDIGDLYESFRRPDCLAREVIQLDEADKTVILEAFRTAGKNNWANIIKSIAQIEILMNGTKLPLSGVHFSEPSLSLVFEFNAAGRKENTDLDRYQVIIRTLFLRSYGVFPIVLAEPTYNPYIELSYSDSKLTRVSSAPFLTSEMPFQPRVIHDRELKRKSIDTANENGEPARDFIFTWQSS